MRNATGNVSPCSSALRGDEIADVVQRDDRALIGALRIAGDANVQNALSTVALQLCLTLVQTLAAGARFLENWRGVGQDILELHADKTASGLGRREQTIRRCVAGGNDAIRIDADHAGGYTCEHRLSECATLVIQRVSRNQSILLLAQLLRHFIERFAEVTKVAFGTSRRHLDVEIAGSDFIGRTYEPPDRRNKLIGEGKTEPDRRQKHCQR